MMKYLYIVILLVVMSCSKDDGSKSDFKIIHNRIDNAFSEQPNDAILLSSDEILTLVTSKENNGLKLLKFSTEDGTVTTSNALLNNTNTFGRDLYIDQNTTYILSDYEVSAQVRNIKCTRVNGDLTVGSSLNIQSDHHEVAVKMIKHQNGKYIILGNRRDKDTETWGFVLYETDGNIILNEFSFPHIVLQSGSDIIAKDDGSGFYVFAHVIEDVSRGTDFVLYAFNSNVEVLSKKYFGSVEYEEARQILIDNSGQIYLFGHSAAVDILHQMYLVKLNSNLDVIFEKHYGSSYHDGGQAFCFDGVNTISLVGRTDAPNNTDESIYFLKVDANGNQHGEKILGDDSSNRADIVLNKDGTDYILGYTTLDDNTTRNIEFYKVSR